MTSDCKSPIKKKGKRRKEIKWADKTTPKAISKAKRQADRQEDEQIERQTERSFVGLSILSDSKSGVYPPLVNAPRRPWSVTRFLMPKSSEI